MPGDPKECHRHARACIELARRATNPAHQQSLMEIAQTWLTLAHQLEQSQTLLEAYPPSPAPPPPPDPDASDGSKGGLNGLH